VEEELLTWKQERRRHRGFGIPWRPLLLVASASFFIASFVLPSSVNSVFDWLLDLLAVGSSLAWYSGRRKDSRGLDA
jgi:amino acid permease